LLRDLLAFSRVNQQRVEFAPVRLSDVVSAVLAFLSPEIERTGARVDRAGNWPVVLAHETTLTQILLNLLGNALKFVRPGEAPVIRLWADERDAKVRVWIEDEGIGIAPEYREQIFRLFNRLNRDAYPGTGVGLAIVQKALQRMGGEVGLESAADHGCRFWFELPAATHAEPGPREAPSVPPALTL
jgi:signal transduction histidine kinase